MKNILDFRQHSFEKTKHLNESESPYFGGDSGKYSKIYKSLYNEFVPNTGPSKYVIGELIRCVSRLIHEYYNNGNGNACEIEYGEECYDVEYWDDDSEEYYTDQDCEEVEIDRYPSEFYESFLQFVEQHGPKDIIKYTDKIREIICEESTYDENQSKYYTEFADEVIKFVYDNYNDRRELKEVDPAYYTYHNR